MSEENKETTFENKCSILAELWMDYRDQEDLKDFVDYNDLGLPLAFLLTEAIVPVSPKGKAMLNETFDLLLAVLEVEDAGFDTLEELMIG